MAVITTSGFSDLLKDLQGLADDTENIVEGMLDAGADVAVEAWRDGIQQEEHKIRASDGKGYVNKRGYVDTGDMLQSVGRASNTRKKNTAEIYPQGKDRKGVRNAEKAFILNYGTSSYQGSRFVEDLEEKASPDIYAAMGNVMDDALKKHGL